MHAGRLEPTVVGATCWTDIKAYSTRLFVGRGLSFSPFRKCPALHAQRSLRLAQLRNDVLLASSNGSPRKIGTTIATTRQSAKTTTPGGTGGNDPEDDPGSSNGSSFQIGLDPITQQLGVSALTAGSALSIATLGQLDLSSALRFEVDAFAVALQLSAPVLLLLLAVAAPRWAPPYKGSELERLRHNYYMTAQVLRLYLDLDDEDEDGSSGSGGSWEDGGSSGGGGERARVRRRLRLEQMVGWGTISSGLALLQAFTLQPWNPPTANSVFGVALAGRSAQQIANEFLVRGAGWGLLSGWVAGELQSADASDGILFFGKVFGGPDAVKYAAGLALVALALPGALWEARAARNFVRASVVGPVRDAAIFCTGNGVDEPAYCDPRGFAMMAARRPANAAPVADVVTRTRGWRSGPATSYSSMGSMDMADLETEEEAEKELGQQHLLQPSASLQGTSPTGAAQPATPAPAPASDSPQSRSPTQQQQSNSSQALSLNEIAAKSPSSQPEPGGLSASPSHSRNGSASSIETRPASAGNDDRTTSDAPSSSSSSSSSKPSIQAMPRVGPTVSTTTAAFEWDSEDMSVLLRVETFQDKIALWSSLYYHLLAAFAINGAFLASDCNLLASFVAAWLLRTGPLLLSELRARAAAEAAMRG